MSKGPTSVKVTAVIIAACIGAIFFFVANPFGAMAWNSWFGLVQRADDATNYETLKQVEDTCRSMIASYEADRLTYEQYKDSEDSEERSWAAQARMRANRTASTYNNYILENSYVWADNVPEDIDMELEYLE